MTDYRATPIVAAMLAASLMLMAVAGAAVAELLEDGKVAAEHQLPMSELEALRAKLISLWNPPQAVSKNPDQYVVTIRIRLSRDHRLVGQPEVLNSGEGPLFEATRDSAIQAVIQAQPYGMLSPSTYDVWKEMTLNFNPRDVFVPEPSETSTPAPPKTPREDLAYYPEYVPSSMSGVTAAAGCEEPLVNTLLPWTSLEACHEMYKASSFIEFPCEREALFKQRTAPHLLQQYDIKWLSNVANRKRACMELLAKKGKLTLWDTISRWWKGEN
jgi:hypothetical protein